MKTLSEIKALIAKMTTKEKIAQINQPHYGWLIWFKDKNNKFQLTQEFKDYVEEWGGVGSIYGLLRTDPWTKITPENGFKDSEQLQIVEMVQEYLLKNTKHHIQALITEENPHGHQSLYSEVFPPNYTVGNSFDLKLYEEVINFQREQLFQKGVNIALMSGLDIPVDKRWGRTEECYSEDPYLVSQFMSTAIKSMQQTVNPVSVVAKHFIAYGASLGGKNGQNAPIGCRELNEVHLQPFLAACQEKADGIMVAYNDIDGIPCIANKTLLTDLVRKKYCYEGLLMADGFAIDALINNLGVDSLTAAKLAFNAGINMSLWDKAYLQLEQLLKNKVISEADLDNHVLKVLELKNKHNLLGEQFITPKIQVDTAIGATLNKKMACSAAVLLKNTDQILPLKGKQNILVIGDDIDDLYQMTGDYSPFLTTGVSYFSGLKQFLKDQQLTFCTLADFNEQKVDDRKFDVVLAFIGGNSKRDFSTEFDKNGAAKSSKLKTMTSGEGVDFSNLNLPSQQNEMLKNFKNENLVFILNSGKPQVLTKFVELGKAVLVMHYPGQRGGQALAEILAGESEPSGRLSYSLPKYEGINDLTYNSRNISNANYFDIDQEELFEFGFGLGYGKRLEFKKISKNLFDDFVEISMEVFNPNLTIRSETLQIYEKSWGMVISPRRKKLRNFYKIMLNPNEKKALTFRLNIKDFEEYVHSNDFELIDKSIRIEIALSSKETIYAFELILNNEKLKWIYD